MKTIKKKHILLIIILIILIVLVYSFGGFLITPELEFDYLGSIKFPDSLSEIRKELLKNRIIDSSYFPVCYITTSHEKSAYEKRWELILPDIDFSKNYLLIVPNRKLESAFYYRFFYDDNLGYYFGKIKYKSKHYSDKSFLYKINKVIIK